MKWRDSKYTAGHFHLWATSNSFAEEEAHSAIPYSKLILHTSMGWGLNAALGNEIVVGTAHQKIAGVLLKQKYTPENRDDCQKE